MRRGCLWTVGVLIGLLVLGYVYITLNPPLGNSETGYLSQLTSRDVALTASRPVAAFRVGVRPSPGIYANAFRPFEPLLVRASLVADGVPVAGPNLRLYPVDGLPIDMLHLADDGHSATWLMDCDEPEPERPCPRDYLLVVAAPSEDAADVRLELFAEQKFPLYTDTPFMVSIDLQVEPAELPETARLLTGETSGSVELSSRTPVARYSLVLPPADPGTGGGATLVAAVDHIGQILPAGLRAPPPIQVAVVDATGRVIGDVQVRPGSPNAIALPQLAGPHRLIAWWQDRADQEYQLTWSLERASLGSGAPPVVESGDPGLPAFLGGEPTQGSTEVMLGTEEAAVPLYLALDPAISAPDGLPSWLGVLELRVLVEPEDETDEPMLLELVAEGDLNRPDAERVPVVVQPGQVAEVALAALPDCASSPCEWALLLGRTPPGSPADEPVHRGLVRVSWEAVVRLWRLEATVEVGAS